MVLDLKGFLNGGARSLDVDVVLDYTGEKYAACQPFVQPVHFTGTVQNRAEVTKLCLFGTAVVEMLCDRCGRPTRKEMPVNIDRVLVTELEGEDDGSYLILPDEQLNLYDVCLEEIILSLPTKHLCREDCKGICYACGKNLNDGACDCTENV